MTSPLLPLAKMHSVPVAIWDVSSHRAVAPNFVRRYFCKRLRDSKRFEVIAVGPVSPLQKRLYGRHFKRPLKVTSAFGSEVVLLHKRGKNARPNDQKSTDAIYVINDVIVTK